MSGNICERISATAQLAESVHSRRDSILVDGPDVSNEVGQYALRQLGGRPSAARDRRLPLPLLDPVECRRHYERFRSIFIELLEDPRWGDAGGEDLAHTVAIVERLGTLLDRDPQLEDPAWDIRDALDHIDDMFETMYRRVERRSLDNPAVAAQFVARELDGLGSEAFRQIVGTPAKDLLRVAREGGPETGRIALIAQLLYYLRRSMAPEGYAVWFGQRHFELGGRTPTELMDDDVDAADPVLRELARAGRGQLAT